MKREEISYKEFSKYIRASKQSRNTALEMLYKDKSLRNKATSVIKKMLNISLLDNAESVFIEGLIEFVKAVENNKFKELSEIDTFIIGICRNKCYERNRKEFHNSVSIEEYEIPDFDSPQNIFVNNESGFEAICLQKINNMKQRCIEILTLYLFEEKQKNKEIAKDLDLSEQYVKESRAKCLEELRNLLFQDAEAMEIHGKRILNWLSNH